VPVNEPPGDPIASGALLIKAVSRRLGGAVRVPSGRFGALEQRWKRPPATRTAAAPAGKYGDAAFHLRSHDPAGGRRDRVVIGSRAAHDAYSDELRRREETRRRKNVRLTGYCPRGRDPAAGAPDASIPPIS